MQFVGSEDLFREGLELLNMSTRSSVDLENTRAPRNMFLSTALQKILAEKETKKSQHVKLRTACEKALTEINEEVGKAGDSAPPPLQVGPNSPLPPPQPEDKLVNADKYFTPFRLACESKSPRIIRTALDCLQKLMAYGHVSGNMLAEVEGFPDAMRLVDLIVDIVCRCFIGEATDDGVQLQILKALLTAVTSTTCEVHEGTLLKAIRTCYNIYLTSKNLVNQTTAKATLTQMVSVVFQRLESLSGNASTYVHPSTSLEQQQHSAATAANAAALAATAAQAAAAVSSPPTTAPAATADEPNTTPSDSTAAAAAPPAASTEEPTEPSHDGDAQDSVSMAASEDHVEVHDANAEPSGGAAETQPEPENSATSSGAAAASQQAPAGNQDLGVAYLDMETETDTLSASTSSAVDPKFGHIYRKDAYLVFRSMCKLSMKDLPDRELVDPRSHDLRSKILSLELQLSILQNAGSGFQKDPLFIDAIKQFLCVALSKNGVSHMPSVFELSLAIFMMLLTKFKLHLKVQIEVFFREILLSMLEISTSSFQHKWLVMVCLAKITSDAQTVVDLYVNFDCDEYRTNIFERMVGNLSRIAQGRLQLEPGTTPAQDQNMRKKGLECLHAIVRALDRWSSQLCEEAAAEQEEAAAPRDGPDLNESRSEPATAPAPANPTGDGLNEFEARKRKKELREEGIELFNQKPKKGVAFMQQHGFIGPKHEDVAYFLLHEERLDRAAIGEYVGEPGEYELTVMHRYVDLIDFKPCKRFLDGLRLFLGNFRLPGESQKIDRLMEKFAQRYCEVHKDQKIFASADAAYVLAYSVIMLTTDLHNVKVKKKITLEDFIKMTRGINDSKDLPVEFVTEIYHDIAKQEIQLKSGPPKAPVQNVDLSNVKARQAMHNEEMSKLASNVTEAMNRAVQGGEEFTTATHIEHVRPMFKVVWNHFMSGFTVPLGATTEDAIADLCLEGLRTSVHIACLFNLDQERNAFVQALAKFTSLTSDLANLRPKNVGAIKSILDIAVKEGNSLGDAWKDVLTVVSQLEQAAVIGSLGPTKKNQQRSAHLPDTASQSIVVSTDKIFARTVKLNGDAIVDFVKALCAVSMEELLNENPPRMYSLAKMVEIAYYNMERIRLEWSHIWAVMGEHFNKVGCLSNPEVAFFAVDSLRQLSIKFLEKGELANYTFQKDFLKPFEYIMNHNKAVPIRDMVVRCVAQMVQAKASNIRSGWKNIFFVFLLAASDSDQNIVELAFSTTKHIFDNYFAKNHVHRASLIATSFMDAVNCMAEFACNSFFPEISMESIRQLRRCATTVSEAPELFVDPNEDQSEEPKIWVKGWFPVLFGLSRIVNRCKMDVRTRALTVMFEIMKTYGHLFSSQWWSDLFSVVFRIFDDKKLQGMATDQERVEWMKTTCTHALRSIIDVVSLHFEVLQSAVLAELFQLLQWCIHRDNEQLASAGTECLNLLVLNNGQRFTDKTWQMTCDTIRDLFESTAPKELMTFKLEDAVEESESDVEKKEKFEKMKQQWRPLFNAIIIKCVVQLELIQTVEWILLSSTKPESHNNGKPEKEGGDGKQAPQQLDPAEFNQKRLDLFKKATEKPLDRAGELFECLTSERIIMLLDCLMRSHEFGKAFNSNSELRTALWKAGFMKNRSKPNLLNQETLSLSCALRIMFRIIDTETRKDIWAEIDSRAMQLCKLTLTHFVTGVAKETRSIWVALIVLILREVTALKEELFIRHATFLYEAICDVLTLSFDSPMGDMAFHLSAFFTRARKYQL